MDEINSKISRKKLYKKIYKPCEITKTEKICEASDSKFYDEAAKLLAIIYLSDKGEGLYAKK